MTKEEIMREYEASDKNIWAALTGRDGFVFRLRTS